MLKLYENETVIVSRGRWVGHWGIVTHVGFDGCSEHDNCKDYIKLRFTGGLMDGRKSGFKRTELMTEKEHEIFQEQLMESAAALFQDGQR